MTKEDLIEIVSYICWTVSVYIMTYYSLNKIAPVDTFYRIAVMLLWISTMWLYKLRMKELTKEIIKSTCILIVTSIIPLFLNAEYINTYNVLKTMINTIIPNLINAGLCYGFIIILKMSNQYHGPASIKLETLTLIIVALGMFFFKLPIIISLLLGVVFNNIRGYHLFIKSLGIGRIKKPYPVSKKKAKRRKKQNNTNGVK